MSWIDTISGRKFTYDDVDPKSIVLDDIFMALSNTCRFSGHVRKFYSVSEHSVKVASLLPKAWQAFGLMHDGSEAYMSDITTPLKGLCRDYQRIEKDVQDAIYQKFCGGVPNDAASKALKMADMMSLKWEAYHLTSHGGENWPCLEGIPMIIGKGPDCVRPLRAVDDMWATWRQINASD